MATKSVKLTTAPRHCKVPERLIPPGVENTEGL